MAEWRESQKHDSLLCAELQKFCFRKIRVRFDLDHGGLNSCGFVDGQQSVQSDVRQTDGATSATVYQAFHRPPRVEQCHTAIVGDIATLIARILLVPRFE